MNLTQYVYMSVLSSIFTVSLSAKLLVWCWGISHSVALLVGTGMLLVLFSAWLGIWLRSLLKTDDE